MTDSGKYFLDHDGDYVAIRKGWGYSQSTYIRLVPRSRPRDANDFARRIVACLNACEGIDVETLEAFPVCPVTGDAVADTKALNAAWEIATGRKELPRA